MILSKMNELEMSQKLPTNSNAKAEAQIDNKHDL